MGSLQNISCYGEISDKNGLGTNTLVGDPNAPLATSLGAFFLAVLARPFALGDLEAWLSWWAARPEYQNPWPYISGSIQPLYEPLPETVNQAMGRVISNSAEAKGIWPILASGNVSDTVDLQNYIAGIYSGAFQRVPDPGGLASFTAAVQNGSIQLQDLAWNILSDAAGNDVATMQAVSNVADLFYIYVNASPLGWAKFPSYTTWTNDNIREYCAPIYVQSNPWTNTSGYSGYIVPAQTAAIAYGNRGG